MTRVLIAAVAGLIFCGTVAAQTPKLPSAPEIPNFSTVAPGIYRGAAPTEAGLRALKALGVRHIIDLRIEKKGQDAEAKTVLALGVARTRIRLGREAPTAKQVEQFLRILDDPTQRPVFVHCQYGADRTGAMVGIWRVSRQGWGFEQTWKEMRHFGFKPFLRELKGAVQSRAKK